MRWYWALTVLCLTFAVASARADPIGMAYRFCARVEKAAFVTECKVEVHADANSINLTIDMSALEAQKTCIGLAPKLTRYFSSSRRPWILRIYSPYSGNRPIARCSLN